MGGHFLWVSRVDGGFFWGGGGGWTFFMSGGIFWMGGRKWGLSLLLA